MSARATRPGLAGRHPRGTVYLIVLISVAIITVIGLSGLYAAQVQGRQVRESTDAVAARISAEAAIEAGMALIDADPNWRAKLGNGEWFSDRAFGGGLVSLSVRDPEDGDVTNSSEDPIILRGTGKVGDARQMIEVELSSTPAEITSLDAAAHAGRVMAFDGASVTADAPLTSNDSTWASAANVVADVESVGIVFGATFTGSVTADASARGMPSADAVTSLTAVATPITMDEIATVSSNIAANGHANFSTTNWSPHNCVVSHATDSPHEGEGYIVASSRSAVTSGPLLELTAEIENNESYTVSAHVRVPVSDSIRVFVITESKLGERRIFVLADRIATPSWTHFSGTVTPTWDDGDGLDHAVLYVRSLALTTDIHVDAVSIVPATLGPPVIENVALSADWNPYGATNADGIYWIDCGGNDLIIRDSRIHGTLVLTDPGNESVIEGSVAWSSSGTTPALVVSGDVAISLDDADLEESSIEVNFNPGGFGEGAEDSDASDLYASMIQGLVYVTNDLKVANRSRIDGLLIAGRDLTFTGNNVQITHDAMFASSPPTGYTASSRLTLDRRSWTKVVD